MVIKESEKKSHSFLVDQCIIELNTASQVCDFDVRNIAGLCIVQNRIWVGCRNTICSFDLESGAFISFVELGPRFEVSDLCFDGNYLYVINNSNSLGRTICKVVPETGEVLSGMVTWKNRSCYLRATYGIDYCEHSIYALSRPSGSVDRAIIELSPRSARVRGMQQLNFDTCIDRCVVGLVVVDDFIVTLEQRKIGRRCVSVMHSFSRSSGEHLSHVILDIAATSFCYANNTFYIPENFLLSHTHGDLSLRLGEMRNLTIHRLRHC